MSAVAENLARVRGEIAAAAERAGRDPGSVRLIAVSKLKSAALVREALDAGQMDFGENYAQELRDKMKEVVAPGLRWHFIGGLQKNKVKYLIGRVALVHSVDSRELAAEIGRLSAKSGVRTRVLIEVNTGGEASKSGVAPEAVLSLAREVRALGSVELAGLMTMPPYVGAEEARRYYRALWEMRDRMREELGDPGALAELSMGLSHDFAAAVEEGATMVRVGTAIFGERS